MVERDTVDPFILKDLLDGDESVYKERLQNFNYDKIQLALDKILNNQNMTAVQKLNLLKNSWKIFYRRKPPSPEEFLTTEYLGDVAESLYPRIKKNFLEFYDESKPYRDAVLFPHIGYGKQGRNDALIMTPTGYTTHGSVKVGDDICAPDGTIEKVVKVEPQGLRDDLYEIEFSDKRKVVVGLEHLWKAFKTLNSRKWDKELKKNIHITPAPNWKTVTTKDIVDDLEKNPKSRWAIPLTKPVLHKEKKHLIPAYVLGTLLGDGQYTFVGSNIDILNRVKELSDKLRNPTYELTTQEERPNLSTTYNFNSSWIEGIERLQLTNKTPLDKFIPEEYLYDSIANRVALLQGLMDTDGIVDINGRIKFHSVSPLLISGLCTLVRGLGGLAYPSQHPARKNRIGNTEYSVSVQFPNNEISIFSLKRKQERVDANFNRKRVRKGTKYLFIKSIAKVEPAEATCIMVDHPEHLYLTDEYIVTHNSFLSVLMNLYTTLHTSFMRDPKKYFGLNQATTLYHVLCSFNLSKSQEVLLDPFMNILERSEIFQKVRTKEDMVAKDKEFNNSETIDKIYWTTASRNGASALQFSGNLNYKLASDPNHIIGLSIVMGTMSELSFFRDAGKSDDWILAFYNRLKSRVETRMKGNFWGRTVLDSSPNDLESPIDRYCYYDADKNARNFVIKGSRWKHIPEDFSSLDDTFPVYLGGNGKPPMILQSTEGYDASEVLLVPKHTAEERNAMYNTFQADLITSLKDLAGIPQGAQDKLFYDHDKIDKCFIPSLKSIYGALKADSKESPYNLIWNQIKNDLFTHIGNAWRFYYKPSIPRVIHVDQSVSGDMTAIACVHIERKAMTTNSDTFDLNRDLVYVVDFVIPIHPYGGRINLDAIKEFLLDLRTEGALAIESASYDTYQSEASLQYLERAEFKIEHLSVDETVDPYFFLSQLIEQGNLKMGRNVIFKNNLKSLRITRRKTRTGEPGTMKVDHTQGDLVDPSGADMTWESSLVGINAKDCSDAVAGAVYLAKAKLANDGRALSQIFSADEITLTIEQKAKKTSDLLKNLGMGFLIT